MTLGPRRAQSYTSAVGGEASFGGLLRSLRRRAGLSQEELAFKAYVSTRAISDLERGVNARPRLHTAVALADGLGLTGHERIAFERHARPDNDPPAVLPALAPRSRPPLAVDSFVDDAAALDALLEIVADRRNRLITLTGPGGAGKSRLALELAHRVDGQVAFVPLASLRDAALFAAAVAEVCGAAHGPTRTHLETLIEHLGPHAVTLVLDNLEQIVAASSDVAAMLRACPRLTVVATSRVPLRIAGEVRFRVPLLTPPSATRLFLERAAGIDCRGEGTADGEAIAELCRRLDGLPLAIELAAARCGVVAPREMLAHLDRVLDLLKADRRDAPEHHATMRTALEWSFGLLPPAAQQAFEALGAFTASASTDAAMVAWGLSPDAKPQFYDVAETLAEAHLVNVERSPDGEIRLDLFEITRQFAREKLEASGRADVTRERLTQYFADLVTRAEPELSGPDMMAWFDRLDRELPNLRAIGRYLSEQRTEPAADTNLRLAAGLQRYWDIRSRWPEGTAWLRDALSHGGGHPASRARAHKALAVMHRCLGDLDAAEAELQRASDDYAAAGDDRGIASCLNNRGVATLDRARYELAIEIFGRALAMCDENGDVALAGLLLNNLGLATIEAGHLREAVAVCHRGHRLLTAQGNLHGLCWVEDNMATALTLAGHPAWAERMHRRSIVRRIALGDENGFVWSLEALAEAWTHLGQTERAGVSLGFVAGHRHRLGVVPVPLFVSITRRRTEALISRIGAARLRELWDEGLELPPDVVKGWFTD